MTRLASFALAALVCTSLGASAAEEQAVALLALDSEGTFVADLRPEEVIVLENGEPREVVDFRLDDRRLDVALVIDSSAEGTRNYLSHAYEDVPAFYSSLPEKTRVTVWSTGERPRRTGELKGDPEKMEKVVGQTFGAGGPNALLDTLVDAAERLTRSSGRRRAIVAVSGASAGHTSWMPRDVTARVGKARTVVRAVMFRQGDELLAARSSSVLRDPSNLTMVGVMDHERILGSLARSTGGRFESTGTAVSVGGILQSFARELAGQYRLRYASVRTKGPRRVEVNITRAGVQSRLTVDAP